MVDYKKIICILTILIFFTQLGSGPIVEDDQFPPETGVDAAQRPETDRPTIISEKVIQPESRGSRVITENDLVWPMFGKDKYHTFISKISQRGISKPAEKWSVGANIDSLGAAIGNFNPNVFGTTSDANFIVFADEGIVYIVDGETGASAWEMDADDIDGLADNDRVATSPAIGDLNKNGKMDIVFALDDGANNSYVYTYEPVIKFSNGEYNWSSTNHIDEQLWAKPTSVDMSFSSPVLDDLNSDGYLDVIIGGADTSAKVFAFSGKDGTALEGWPYTLSGTRVSTPAIYKFGLNSRVVITSVEAENYYVYVISNKGQTLHQKTIDMSLPIGFVYTLVPSPAVGQLNSSSTNDEIVVLVPKIGTNARVFCLASDLSTLWTTTYTEGQFESSPAIVDIDKDAEGELDVIAASWDSLGTNIYAIKGRTGELIWEREKNLGIGVQNLIASPGLADLTKDGYTDAVFAAQNVLFALNGTSGNYLWNFTLPSSTGTRFIRSSPAMGDVDKDKFHDIFIDGVLISHYIIDLTISESDVQFSEEIVQGGQIGITALVHNTGEAQAESVTVSFFESGKYIDNATIDAIPGGDTRGASITWVPELPGDNTLTIKVDPDNSIEEVVENNNEVSLSVYVAPAFPDLTFDELRFYRGDGKQIDNINTHLIENEESRVSAVVRNIGGLEAKNAQIRFRQNNVNLGGDILIGLLGANKTVEVGVNWTPSGGYYTIDALADPTNAIIEADENNNNIAESALFVKANDPGGASFIISGDVFQPDGTTPAASAAFTITNERSKSTLGGITDLNGKYSKDLKNIQNGYMEGDEISVFVTDGTNESRVTFRAYSEDQNRYDRITLSSLPRYSVDLSVPDDSKEIDPGSILFFPLTVKNTGNTNSSIDLNHTQVIDVSTGQTALNWSVNLDAYSVDDLSAGEQIERQLTLRAPSKSSEAKAGTVVRVKIRAVTNADRSQSDELTVYATLNRMYSIGMSVAPTYMELDPSEYPLGEFLINLTNLGNGPDQINLYTSNVSLDAINIDLASPVEIEAGKSVSTKLKVHVLEDHPPGLYFLTVHAESADGSSSKLQHLSVMIVRPDLSISKNDVEIPAKLPSMGQSVTITAKIHNNGTAAARSVEISLFDDGIAIALDSITEIQARSFAISQLTFTLDKSGSYNLKVVVDPNDFIYETNENNNEYSFNLEIYPDLTFIGNLETTNYNPREGDKVTINAVIANKGLVTVASRFYVEFYYYKSGVRTSIDRVEMTSALNSGSSIDVSIDWYARQGVGSIYCMVDSTRTIYENDETNNEIMLNLTVNKALLEEPEEEGFNLLMVAGLVFLIVIILIIYFMLMTPRSQDDDEDMLSESDLEKIEGRKRTGRADSGAKTSMAADKARDIPVEKPHKVDRADDDEEDEETDEEPDSGLGILVKGVRDLNPFSGSKSVKKKKVKRKKRKISSEKKGKEELPSRAPSKEKIAPDKDTLSKLRKAENLIKARELQEKEKNLKTRTELLTRRERELKSMKDDLVEIGILEADVIDDLEREEVEVIDEEEDDEAVEVEPLD